MRSAHERRGHYYVTDGWLLVPFREEGTLFRMCSKPQLVNRKGGEKEGGGVDPPAVVPCVPLRQRRVVSE